MNLFYNSQIIKLSAVDWKSDHSLVVGALRQARGQRVVLRAACAGAEKREIDPRRADLGAALTDAGIDLALPFDLEIVIRHPLPQSPVQEALRGGHGFVDRADRQSLHHHPGVADGGGDVGESGASPARPGGLRGEPMFFRANGMFVDLVDLHRGASVFLILNGPSFARVDHARLRRPGILTFGVNNGAHRFRPHYWTCVDDPTRFMESIWRDPTVTKFVPLAHFEKPVWDTRADRVTTERVRDFPNVFGYRRNEQFQAERWLTEPTVNWGNHADLGGGRSVMLAALRLCHLLGFRRVFLLGCDFHMDAGHGYWFPEQRSDQAIRNNNTSYAQLHEIFAALRPHFDAAGFEVLNCTQGSRLDPALFPHYPLEQALAETEIDTSPSTEGMYVDRFRKAAAPSPDSPLSPSSSLPASPSPDHHPATERIRGSLLAAIGEAPVQAAPFFHLVFERVFPPEIYAALHDHLPDAADYEDLRHRDALQADGSSARLHLVLTPASLARLPAPIRDFWTPLHHALASPAVKHALFARHYPALFRRFGRERLRGLSVEPRISLIRDLAGYRIGIHRDIDQKVITTQFYLPRDHSQAHLGTKFYRKAPRPGDDSNGTPDPGTGEPEIREPFEFDRQMAFLPNSGYSFTVAPDSWHGVDPLAAEDAPRDSVMLVYYLAE